MKKSVLSVLCTTVVMLCGCNSLTVDNSTISTFDTQRFLGKWYEIARFDHSFEHGMTHCTATYEMRPDGKIKVTNRGMRHSKPKESVGKAKLTDEPGLLRVSFFGPFYSDYRVMILAPDYTYALIGSGSDDYLWILARTPKLPQSTLNTIIAEAQRRGYDTSQLIWVEQYVTR